MWSLGVFTCMQSDMVSENRQVMLKSPGLPGTPSERHLQQTHAEGPNLLAVLVPSTVLRTCIKRCRHVSLGKAYLDSQVGHS